MKLLFAAVSFIVFLNAPAAAQTKEVWLPAQWTTPTTSPAVGANRVILLTSDSVRVSLHTLATILKKRDFSVELLSANSLSAGRTLPDSLRLKGGAGINVTVIVATETPGVVVLSSNGIPNLRKLHRLTGPTAARPYGRKVHYPGETGTNTGIQGQLPQIAFDMLVSIANEYPGASIRYSTAQFAY